MITSPNPSAATGSPNPNSVPPAVRATSTCEPDQATPSAKQPSATGPKPSEEEIRDYANHLFVQRGSVHGHDWDDWLEAEACLAAKIPKESSRTRMHQHTQITVRTALALVKHGRS